MRGSRCSRRAGGFGYVAAALGLAVLLGSNQAAAQAADAAPKVTDPVQANMDVIRQWVQARETLAKERADWQSEKARLQDMIEVRKSQLAQLNDQLASAQKETDVAEKERTRLAQDLDSMKGIEGTVEDAVVKYEQRMRTLLPQLPTPLQQELQPLSVRLPDPANKAPVNLSASQRMQTVIGMLTQIEKYNDALDLAQESREIDGKRIQVQTMYFGIAAAYWVDGAGTAGGTGAPGPNGWVWTRDDSLAPQIRNMIAMYHGSNEVTYVTLPAKVSK